MQRAQPGFVRVLPDRIGSPPTPPRALSAGSDQLIVVVEDVTGDPFDDGAQRGLLGFVGDEVVIDRIDEVMADDLVGARISLPAPGAVGRVVPLAVLGLLVLSDLDERPGWESCNAGDRFEAYQGVHALPGVRACIRFAGDLVTE